MQTNRQTRSDRGKGHVDMTRDRQAVSEVMRLYTAWIAVLMKRLETDVLRVGVREITEALDGFSCAVSREEDEYVIRLGGAPEEPASGDGKEADT